MGDRAFFLVQYFSGERGGDLTKLLVQEIFKSPSGDALIIRQTFGKTRTDRRCVIKAVDGADYCPVAALKALMEGAPSLGVDIDSGYVFCTTTSDGHVLPKRVTQQALNKRLQTYLTSIGLFSNETTHSLRGGCAIILKLCHDSVQESCEHVGWKTSASWEYYVREKTYESQVAADTLRLFFAHEDQSNDKIGCLTEVDLWRLDRAFPCVLPWICSGRSMYTGLSCRVGLCTGLSYTVGLTIGFLPSMMPGPWSSGTALWLASIQSTKAIPRRHR